MESDKLTDMKSILAYSPASPQPGMSHNYYLSDYERFSSAWHASHCSIEECDLCNMLCDRGIIISCDSCSNIHHTDWLGWYREVDSDGKCEVLCPECITNLP